jgi:hypothetical protein
LRKILPVLPENEFSEDLDLVLLLDAGMQSNSLAAFYGNAECLKVPYALSVVQPAAVILK